MPIRSLSLAQVLTRVLMPVRGLTCRSAIGPAFGLTLGLALTLSASVARALPVFDWFGEGSQTAEAFGFGATPAGDVNGDGYDDFVVASPYYDLNGSDRGRVRAYYGSPSGLGVTSWQYDGGVSLPRAHARRASALEAFAVVHTGAERANGDGLPDWTRRCWTR